MMPQASKDPEAILVAELSSTDHFKVCSALRALAGIEGLRDETLARILRCTESKTLAVERTALTTLSALKPHAGALLPGLVKRLALRLKDAGCTWECCGYSAFHGPIADYVDALRSLLGKSNLDSFELPREDLEFIAMLLAQE